MRHQHSYQTNALTHASAREQTKDDLRHYDD